MTTRERRKSLEGIVGQIVGRRHVGEPVADVVAYALSKLKPEAGKELREDVAIVAKRLHLANRKIYCSVMGGR
ncbi:MAG: hypothetical protein GY820_39485 [Gammaproteobacteria bacterium]|nr:hypothetical protein [Gammaproteobacteria bacterium]